MSNARWAVFFALVTVGTSVLVAFSVAAEVLWARAVLMWIMTFLVGAGALLLRR